MCMKYFNLLNAVIWNEHNVKGIIFFVAISISTLEYFLILYNIYRVSCRGRGALGFPPPEMF